MIVSLDEYIAANLRRKFVWGEHDCVLFAANWVKQATGVDHLEGVPAWTSAKSALRTLQSRGDLNVLLERRFERVEPCMARNGDIALIGRTLFLFYHEHIVAPGKDGLVFIERTFAPCAWQFLAP